jgi:hypothetical protein
MKKITHCDLAYSSPVCGPDFGLSRAVASLKLDHGLQFRRVDLSIQLDRLSRGPDSARCSSDKRQRRQVEADDTFDLS